MDDTKEVGGHVFQGFGSHTNAYPCAYLTAAAAIGMETDDVDAFVKRLDKVLAKCKSKAQKKKLEKSAKTVAFDSVVDVRSISADVKSEDIAQGD